MTRYLLDTHTWLWLQAEPHRIDERLRRKLATAETILLSAASAWEIAIKHALGKLALPVGPAAYVPERMRTSGTEALPIEVSHSLAAGALPTHHRDPFDRLIVAQSQMLKIPLVTADRQLEPYDTEIIWI